MTRLTLILPVLLLTLTLLVGCVSDFVTNDHLASKEMEIGRYYHTQGQYLAAINRFKNVIDDFQTTTHVPEALHRLTEAYLAFGMKAEAKKMASVLGYNFPGSEWYLDSYKILGNKVAEPNPSGPIHPITSKIDTRLQRLKKLVDDGLITPDEAAAKRKEILNSL